MLYFRMLSIKGTKNSITLKLLDMIYKIGIILILHIKINYDIIRKLKYINFVRNNISGKRQKKK